MTCRTVDFAKEVIGWVIENFHSERNMPSDDTNQSICFFLSGVLLFVNLLPG